jgi:SAM-dependent methyltransferase
MIAALDGMERLPQAARLRERSYELLNLAPGARVLDIGCGTGLAVSELAGHGFAATGADVDEGMLALARERFPGCDFDLASGEDLPYEDGRFQGYRADKVVHALADSARLLAEARRVLAPGGRIVLLGQDWDHLAIEATDIPVTRRLIHARADTIAAPWAARRYRGSLLDHGFTEVAVEVYTVVFTEHALLAPILPGYADAGLEAGVVDREQAEAWIADQERRGRDDRFFVAFPMFVASATAP